MSKAYYSVTYTGWERFCLELESQYGIKEGHAVLIKLNGNRFHAVVKSVETSGDRVKIVALPHKATRFDNVIELTE